MTSTGPLDPDLISGAIHIVLKVFADLRNVLPPESEIGLPPGITVSFLLEKLSREYPGLQNILYKPSGIPDDSITILKNGRNIQFLTGFDTVLSDRDIITIFPPSGGG